MSKKPTRKSADQRKLDDKCKALRLAARLLEQAATDIEALRRVSVREAATILNISQNKVRDLLPIKFMARRTHRVLIKDIQEFDARRTLEPGAWRNLTR